MADNLSEQDMSLRLVELARKKRYKNRGRRYEPVSTIPHGRQPGYAASATEGRVPTRPDNAGQPDSGMPFVKGPVFSQNQPEDSR